MIGVAAGLGNVWRFPYMVGEFGGAAFVLVYVLAIAVIGIPALVAAWVLGRSTRRGTVGAFTAAGLPGGRWAGWLFFFGMTAAIGYYTNVLGWVAFFAVGEVAAGAGIEMRSEAILPPMTGSDGGSFVLQMGVTALVMIASVLVLTRGLRRGIERASTVLTPALFASLAVLLVRAVTLPGAGDGLEWYILKFDASRLDAGVILAATGQAAFSLSLGGTFMVVYGSYLRRSTDLPRLAVWTATGDTLAGLLAGFAIFPAVFAAGLDPSSGPGLLFATLPAAFEGMPTGWLFGALFFGSLFGAGFLSLLAAFEVVVAGLTDNTNLKRRRAAWLMAGVAFLFALVPMINQRILQAWDLTYGSGMQTLGALVAAVTVGWALHRSAALRELGGNGSPGVALLYGWIRYVIPTVILAIFVGWVITSLV
jgi:NSS family neurotransmitter:Na+ symporter